MDKELANSQRIIAECLRRTPNPADELYEYIAGIELKLIEISMKTQKLGISFQLFAEEFNYVVREQQDIIALVNRISNIQNLAEWKKNKQIYFQQNFFQKPPLIEDLPKRTLIGPLLKPIPFYEMNTQYSPRMRKSFIPEEQQVLSSYFQNLNIDYEEKIKKKKKNLITSSQLIQKRVQFRETGKHLDNRSLKLVIEPRIELLNKVVDLEFELGEGKNTKTDERQEETWKLIHILEEKVHNIQLQNSMEEEHIGELLKMNDQHQYLEKIFRIHGTLGRKDLEESYIGIKKSLEVLGKIKSIRNNMGVPDQKILGWTNNLIRNFNRQLTRIRQIRNQIDEHIEKRWLRHIKISNTEAWKNLMEQSRNIKIGQIEFIRMCWKSELPKHQKRLERLKGRFKALHSLQEWTKLTFQDYWESWNEDRRNWKKILKL